MSAAATNPTPLIPGSKLGTDPKHTKWCQDIVANYIALVKDQVGGANRFVTRDVLVALVMEKVATNIYTQDNEDAPLWRYQELVHHAYKACNTEWPPLWRPGH